MSADGGVIRPVSKYELHEIGAMVKSPKNVGTLHALSRFGSGAERRAAVAKLAEWNRPDGNDAA